MKELCITAAMGPVLLALLSSLSFGVSDFLQGAASKRYRSSSIMIVSNTMGLAAMAAVLPLSGGIPLIQDYIWGSAAGILLLGGVTLLIYAFRNSPITIASTVIGVVNMAVPALFSIAMRGTVVGPLLGIGLLLALAGIILVNRSGPSEGPVKLLPTVAAIASGVTFGGFSIVFAYTSPGAMMWPLAIGYAVRLALLLLILAATHRLGVALSGIDRKLVPLAGSAGLILAVGSGLYLISLQQGGELVVSSTLISEAPVTTIVLAMAIGRERINTVQGMGILASIIAMALIGLS
jgi:drug/metabolite transporter (DMT)-like permease